MAITEIISEQLKDISVTSTGVNLSVSPIKCTIDASNILLGSGVGSSITTSTDNILIGTNAGTAITSNKYNTIIGYVAATTTTGSNNTFLGYTAGNSNTSGSYNTFIGNQSGTHVTTGSYNICIGNKSGLSSTAGTYNNQIVIGNELSAYNADSSTVIGGTVWLPASDNTCDLGSPTRAFKKIYANNLQLAGTNGLVFNNIPSNQIMLDVSTGSDAAQYTQALNYVSAPTTASSNGVTIWTKTLSSDSSYMIEANIIGKTTDNSYTFGGKIKGLVQYSSGTATICNQYGGTLVELESNVLLGNTIFSLNVTGNAASIKVYPPSISGSYVAAKYSSIVNVTRIS